MAKSRARGLLVGHSFTVNRVAVIGPVGSGKSTLARDLARVTGLPLLQLDELYWRDGPVPTDRAWAAKHAALIAAERWIVDGDYRATAASRCACADTVVWLDPGAWRCTVRILRRQLNGYPAPLADCLRWTWRNPRHGRHETLAMLGSISRDTAIHRLRNASDRNRSLIERSRRNDIDRQFGALLACRPDRRGLAVDALTEHHEEGAVGSKLWKLFKTVRAPRLR
jgi:hypothetical protein